MYPAVPAPEGIPTPIDLKLKANWRFDLKTGRFQSDGGDEFTPGKELPKGAKIAYKVPSLARAAEAKLSKHERDLRRYMHVILPADVSPAEFVDAVRNWPSVAEAHVAPAVSLPGQA